MIGNLCNLGSKRNSQPNFVCFSQDELKCPKAYPATGFVAGKRSFIDDLGNDLESDDPIKIGVGIQCEKIHAQKIRKLFFPSSTYVVRRDLALRVKGYDKRMEPAEDFDFFIKCCDSSPLTVLTEPVVRMRRHEGNTSDAVLRETSIRISKKNLDRLESEPMPEEIAQFGRLKAEWLVRMGDDSYWLYRNGDSLRYYCRSVLASSGILLDSHVGRQIAASLIPISIRKLFKKLLYSSSQ